MRRLKRTRERFLRQPLIFRRRAIHTGAAVAITLGAGLMTTRAAPTSHLLPVQNDRDADLIADREELAIGYGTWRADQNGNEIPDGVDLAQRCAKVIEQLPWDYEITDPNQTHRWLVPTYGLETCPVCGATVNMGPAGIRNPVLGIDMGCPLIAVHYMSHGSFSYEGDVHSGRVNVPLLLWTLGIRYPADPNAHELPLDYSVSPYGQLAGDANDFDGDLLADGEELAIDLNLYNADQNESLIPDGVELAQQCVQIIDALPSHDPEDPAPEGLHKVSMMQRGLEYCEVCGAWVNMGGWEIVNPQLGLSIYLPVIAHHYMAQGSFSYHGDLHAARVDLSLLMAVLEMPARCGDLPTVYPPGDFNRDCRQDFTDLGAFAEHWLESSEP